MNEEIKTLIEDVKFNYASNLSSVCDAMFEVVVMADEAGRTGNIPPGELMESMSRIIDVLKLYKNLLEELADIGNG